MKRFTRLALILWIPAVLAVSPAWAEVEFTPTLGIRFGGSVETDYNDDTIDPSLSIGVTFDISLAPEKWIVALWSHQRAEFTAEGVSPTDNSFELDIDYLHAGGVYRPGVNKKNQPFVMVSAGLTWVRSQQDGFGDALGLSGMIGAGTKVVLSPKIGLRFEGRGFLTFTDVSLSGVCGGIGCTVRFSSGGIFQFEALGGVTFSF